MVRLVSLSVVLTLIVVLGITFFKVIAPFLLPLFLAAIVAIICQPIYDGFVERINGRERLAAGLTTATLVIIVVVPLVFGTLIAALQLMHLSERNSLSAEAVRSQAVSFRSSAEEILDSGVRTFARTVVIWQSQRPGFFKVERDDDLEPELPAEEALEKSVEPREIPLEAPITTDEEAPPVDADDLEERTDLLAARIKQHLSLMMQQVGSRSLGTAGAAIGNTIDLIGRSLLSIVTGLIAFLIFLVALYYFLADGPALIAASERLIPVHVSYQRELLAQFAKVVRSVVLATFLAAFSQGIATALALMICGFDHIFVWFILATMASLIPLAGTWLAWGPCALWLAWHGNYVSAILLTLYGAVFVGMLDNIVRTYILNSETKLHPLLAFISVLGGLQVMGLWGIFIGPVVASCLHALVKIFNHELTELSKERFADLAALRVGEQGALSAGADGTEPEIDSASGHAKAISAGQLAAATRQEGAATSSDSPS